MPIQMDSSGVPYDTPPDELMLMRAVCSPDPSTSAVQQGTGKSAPR